MNSFIYYLSWPADFHSLLFLRSRIVCLLSQRLLLYVKQEGEIKIKKTVKREIENLKFLSLIIKNYKYIIQYCNNCKINFRFRIFRLLGVQSKGGVKFAVRRSSLSIANKSVESDLWLSFEGSIQSIKSNPSHNFIIIHKSISDFFILARNILSASS